MGRVVAVNRFIAKATDKCLPFFQAIKKKKWDIWDENYEKPFQELKMYLGTPPLLSTPCENESLYVYLAVSEHAVSSVLIREEENIQKSIYYTSKAFQGAESRYPEVEKLGFALIISA